MGAAISAGISLTISGLKALAVTSARAHCTNVVVCMHICPGVGHKLPAGSPGLELVPVAVVMLGGGQIVEVVQTL